MKAHDGRPDVLQQIGRFRGERSTTRTGRDAACSDAIFLVIGRKLVAPRRFPHRVFHGRNMAKEVNVKGTASLRLESSQFFAQRLAAERCAANRTESSRV